MKVSFFISFLSFLSKSFLHLCQFQQLEVLSCFGDVFKKWCYWNYPSRFVKVTLYGGSNDTYQSLCHTHQGLDRCLKGLKLLKQYGIATRLTLTLIEKNRKDYARMLDIAHELQLPTMLNAYTSMYTRKECASCISMDELRMSPEETARLEMEYLKETKGDELRAVYAGNGCFLGITFDFRSWWFVFSVSGRQKFPNAKVVRWSKCVMSVMPMLPTKSERMVVWTIFVRWPRPRKRCIWKLGNKLLSLKCYDVWYFKNIANGNKLFRNHPHSS